MDACPKPRVLILNAGSPVASAIARRYAADGWAVGLEIRDGDLPDNDLVVEIWDAGGHINVLSADPRTTLNLGPGSCSGRDFDRVVDAQEAALNAKGNNAIMSVTKFQL